MKPKKSQAQIEAETAAEKQGEAASAENREALQNSLRSRTSLLKRVYGSGRLSLINGSVGSRSLFGN